MNRVNELYQEAIRQEREKKRDISNKAFFISLILLFVAFFLNMIINVQATFIILIVFSAIAFISLLIRLLLVHFISEKPMYEVLIKEIVKEININEQKNIDFKAYSKESDLFNSGGLFPKSASKLNRFQLMMSTDYHTNINVFFSEVFIQTDKARQIFLKGLYVKFDTLNDQMFQIRKKGKEKHKGIKLEKEILEDKTKLFTEGKAIKPVYLNLYKELSNQYKQVYISGINRQIHIAIDDFFYFKRQSNITHTIYNRYYRKIKETIDLVEEISEKISY